jgi:hypothetical protein
MPGRGLPPPPPALPAHPPPPGSRRAGLPLLLRPRRPGPDQDQADPGSGPALAGEENFEFAKDCFGLDRCRARLCTAIQRHLVLVMAALAVTGTHLRARTATRLRARTGIRVPPPGSPGQPYAELCPAGCPQCGQCPNIQPGFRVNILFVPGFRPYSDANPEQTASPPGATARDARGRAMGTGPEAVAGHCHPCKRTSFTTLAKCGCRTSWLARALLRLRDAPVSLLDCLSHCPCPDSPARLWLCDSRLRPDPVRHPFE